MSAKPDAVIVDRDGTLASCFARPVDKSSFAWAQFNAALPFDAVVPHVRDLIVSLSNHGYTIIMTSGRAAGDWDGDQRRMWAMRDWIVKHHLPIDHLFMRQGGDTRRDSIVKLEILDRFITPNFNVRLVIDDRQQVVDAWRSRGLTVLQVVDPDIPPPISQQQGD